jgi:hypothetical protein
MSWAQKLKGWATGESASNGNAELWTLCDELDREARRLARHAEMAPNHSAHNDLSRLAAEQEAIAAELRDALGEKKAAVSPAEPPPPAGLNHWARVVQNLEHMRAQRDRLFDAAKERNSEEEPLGGILEGLAQRMENQLLGLRALIARADPQSLN